MNAEISKRILTVTLTVVTLMALIIGMSFAALLFNSSELQSDDEYGVHDFLQLDGACKIEMIKLEEAIKSDAEVKTPQVTEIADSQNRINGGNVHERFARNEADDPSCDQASLCEELFSGVMDDSKLMDDSNSEIAAGDMASDESASDNLEEDSVRETEIEFN